MTVSVNYNDAAVRNMLSLQKADRQLALVTQRLASGQRITRSADDPSGMTLSNNMRYHNTGLKQASENMENGINMLQTADAALGELNGILNRMRSLTISAGNEGTRDPAEIAILQKEFDNLIESYDRITGDANFGGVSLLTGGLSDNTMVRGVRDDLGLDSRDNYGDLQHDRRLMPSGIQDNSTIVIEPPSSNMHKERVQVVFAGSPSIDSTIDGLAMETRTGTSTTTTALSVTGGEPLTISGQGGTHTLNLASGTTIANLVDQINARSSQLGLEASYDSPSGTLVLQSTAFGHGLLNVQSADLSSGSGIGLWDSDTSDPTNNELLPTTHTYRHTYGDNGGGALTSTSRIADMVDANGVRLSNAGGSGLRFFTDAGIAVFNPAGTNIEELIEELTTEKVETAIQAEITYDSGTNTLTVNDLVASTSATMNLSDNDGLEDIAAFFDANISTSTLTYNAGSGILQVDDPIVGRPPLLQVDVLESSTVQDLLNFVEDHSSTHGITAELTATTGELSFRGTNGPLIVASEDMSLNKRGTGINDLNTTDLEDTGGTKVEPTIFEMSLWLQDGSGPASINTMLAGVIAAGKALDAAIGKVLEINDGSTNYTFTVTDSSSIGDLIDDINASGLEARAEFSGGSLRLVPNNRSELVVRSEDMTLDTQSSIGIWDQDTGVYQAPLLNGGIPADLTDPIAGLNLYGSAISSGTTITISSSLQTINTVIPGAATVSDVVSLVQTDLNAASINATISFSDGALTLRSHSSPIQVSATDMTGGNNIGFFDERTGSTGNGAGLGPDSNGRSRVDLDPTQHITYTDAEGQEQRVILHQIPSSTEGLTFRNVTGNLDPFEEHLAGNDTRFTEYMPGAWTLTHRNRLNAGDPPSMVTTSGLFSATRYSSTNLQSGAQSSQQINVDIPDLRSDAVGHGAGLAHLGLAHLQDLKNAQVLSNGFIEEALKVIDAAIAEVTQERAEIGVKQANGAETALTYLQISIENLTSSESRIRDTDFARESAELSRLNIQYQAATAMLAQANQIPQTVLQLLQG